ncbi:DUF924 family protein [Pseudopelagicola sp. nBUS_19]|uniref:DUF924 family protein n=1 Tax=unclassified Pseudopelagicola TaxID=2649563 RepID=UPI003EB8B325
MVGPEDILEFWLDEVGPSGWYAISEDLDQEILDRFGEAWRRSQQGSFAQWLTYASGTLAYIVLNDQFPRNMFRGLDKAFRSDRQALAAAKIAIDKKWDLRIDGLARQFFYMPLMHSESLCDQERCIRMFLDRMPENGESNLLHARAHREVIRKFGRFPYRNEALSRNSTQPEMAYVAEGGYGETVRELQSAVA